MSVELEYEQKVLITKDDYLNLIEKISEYDHYKDYYQENYYLETKAEFFKKSNSALRLRFKKDKWQKTLKIKSQTVNYEYNMDIASQEAKAILETKTTSLSDVPKEYCQNYLDLTIAKIETHRHEIKYQDGLIVIDKTIFENQVTDYEIECEASSLEKAGQILQAFVKENQLKTSESESKIARYHNYFNEN